MKIEIDDQILNKLKEIIDKTDNFQSVEELVEYLLKEDIDEIKKEDNEPSNEELVEEKLKSLGYLN